ncbi:WXG100 family type VII secretion target [Streptomyces sp. T-3]|nr:WXG100 family type VII secretion target [Streptomyces sp. T-3]
MSAFSDVVDPMSFLTPPGQPEAFPQGTPAKIIGGISDALSPTYWITTAFDIILGVNPLDEAVQWFAGDWEAFAKAGEALQNVGKALDGVADNIKSGNSALDATWDGNAADAAYVYFDEFAKKLGDCKETFESLKAVYDDLAQSAYTNAQGLKGILGAICDTAIIIGVAAAAGTITAGTVIGPAFFYSVAAFEVGRLIALWGEATNLFSTTQNHFNVGTGLVTQFGAEFYAHFVNFPEVGGSYDNQAVSSEVITAGD